MYSGIDPNPDAIRSLLKKFGFRLYEVSKPDEVGGVLAVCHTWPRGLA